MNSSDFASKKLKGRGFSSAPLINKHNKSVNTKEEQNGRSLLPICEADAPLFLSAVYNKKYTSEKITSRYPQSGRSMIEMLGVLAIIGVLSVGGIAGYSKAMMKYRINKTIEQITLITGNMRSFFKEKYQNIWCNGEETIDDSCAVIRKAKIFPDEMVTLDSDGKMANITHAFGKDTVISSSIYSNEFILDFYGIPQEACIELATYDWRPAGITLVGFVSNGNDYYAKPPIAVDKAIEYCKEDPIEMLFVYTSDMNHYSGLIVD